MRQYTNRFQREPLSAGAAALIGLGVSAASTGGQMIWQGKTNKKTRAWNEKMYGIQRADALADRDYANEYNNPMAVKERLKEAGLNPALMYGMNAAGAGGQSEDVRGAAAGNWNPQVPNMGIDPTTLAQIRNINADTKLKETQANKLGGVDTREGESRIALNVLEGVIKDVTGKDMKSKFETVDLPNREMEGRAKTDELSAISAFGQNINEMFINGVLRDKTNAEVEEIMLKNAKTAAETRNIIKTWDKIAEEIKGAKLSNVILELESRLQTETGIDKTSPGWLKILGRLFITLMGGN